VEKTCKQESEFNSNKFHMELYRARQVWRIRKLGTKFNCDLSYRSGKKAAVFKIVIVVL